MAPGHTKLNGGPGLEALHSGSVSLEFVVQLLSQRVSTVPGLGRQLEAERDSSVSLQVLWPPPLLGRQG